MYANYILAIVVSAVGYGFLAAVYDKRVARKFKRKLCREAVLASSGFLVPEKEGANLEELKDLPSAHYLARYNWLGYDFLLLYVESRTQPRPLLSFGWSFPCFTSFSLTWRPVLATYNNARLESTALH
ncbi:hypothetical protein EDB86DRAFT_1753330 [Lactarius hatsudake]|nr:hypothetical protein EDB86DRAFT_1753330 [Lactarius hatsudake]